MFEAQIEVFGGRNVSLGPTDTRDEASRLARAWIDAFIERGSQTERIENVKIARVEEQD